MESLTKVEVLSLTAVALAVLSTAAAVLVVPYVRVRKVLLMLFCITVLAGAAAFWFSFQKRPAPTKPPARPVSSPSPKPSSTASPSAPKQPPESSAPRSQEKIAPGRKAPFYLSSIGDDRMRKRNCVTGEFKGESRINGDSLEVLITDGAVRLCSRSPHKLRAISVKVGVGNYGKNANGIPDTVTWSSRTVRLGERVSPGKSVPVANLHFLIKKRRAELSKSGLIIRVANIALDSGKKNHFDLYTGSGIFDKKY